MNRKQLQALAKTRLKDARALIGRKRWAAAYYLAGYVVECGLKSCLLRHLGESEALFGDDAYLKKLSKCWTHNLSELLSLAGLEQALGEATGTNAALGINWGIVKDWKETSRYGDTNEASARRLLEAIEHRENGVLPWIRSRW